jgi:hypothetical protein
MQSIDVSEEHIAFIFRVEKYAKQDTSVKAGGKQSHLFQADILLCLFFNPEDEGDMFLRNVDWLSTDYTALYDRR